MEDKRGWVENGVFICTECGRTKFNLTTRPPEWLCRHCDTLFTKESSVSLGNGIGKVIRVKYPPLRLRQ